MYDFAIGDVQGCYDPLMRLLEHINFNDNCDRLWFVGDLVNRGPQSLAVLRFIKNLPIKAHITLGNHDLHLLARFFDSKAIKYQDDTLDEVLLAPDGESLCHWLRKQSVLIHDDSLNIVMCHAGIAPVWDLSQAKAYAGELEQTLRGTDFKNFLANMYGNKPDIWSESLIGIERLRVITNYFTRMRFCNTQGRLMLDYKGTIECAPKDLLPWFLVPSRKNISADIVFGHWASLQGQNTPPDVFAIDTGYIWNGKLTTLRLQDRQLFAV